MGFMPFRSGRPLVSVASKAVFSGVVAGRSVSRIDVFLTPDNVANSDIKVSPRLGFGDVGGFGCSDGVAASPMFRFRQICKGVRVVENSGGNISTPGLMDMSKCLDVRAAVTGGVSFPGLRVIKNRLYVVNGLGTISGCSCSFAGLGSINYSDGPRCVGRKIVGGVLCNSLSFVTSGGSFAFPSLRRIKNINVAIHTMGAVSYPGLRTVSKALYTTGTTSLAAFGVPALAGLSKIQFVQLAQFISCAFFGSFMRRRRVGGRS